MLPMFQSSDIKSRVIRKWTDVSEERIISILRVENQPSKKNSDPAILSLLTAGFKLYSTCTDRTENACPYRSRSHVTARMSRCRAHSRICDQMSLSLSKSKLLYDWRSVSQSVCLGDHILLFPFFYQENWFALRLGAASLTRGRVCSLYCNLSVVRVADDS
jgi:hypothetical protein